MAGRPCRPLAERFWEKVDVRGPDDCWEFKACRDKNGYGRIGLGGRASGTVPAYRVAYELIYGPIAKGDDIRHFVCNNPPCCNFMHLLAGDRTANVDDMISSGRYKNAPPLAPDLSRERWQRAPDPEYVCFTCGVIFSRPDGRTQIGKHTYCSRAHYFASKEFRLEERFWAKVDKRGPDDCWPWQASLDEGGYGQFDQDQAHRVAWMMAHGDIPEGLVVRHYVCDYRRCCNVAHMKLGTRRQNSEDMVRKGRQAAGDRSPRRVHFHSYPVGDAHPNAKLTPDRVREMRRLYAAGGETHQSLGRLFDVSAAIAGRIVSRKMWKHVD
jgi:hypothetical protein